MLLKRLVRHGLLLLLTMLLGGWAGAMLVRFAPGFDTDEAQMDATRSAASIEAMRTDHEAQRNVLVYYAIYLGRVAHGDFGESRTFRRPVRELLSERMGATWDLVRFGFLAGVGLGFLVAVGAVYSRVVDRVGTVLSSGLLCLPSAIGAVAALVLDGPVWLCISAVIFPRVFRYSRDLLVNAAEAPHVLAARARGVSVGGLFLRHLLPPAMPQTFALLGITVSTAMAADIPVEVLAGIPGIGQLAWQAANGRDLPVLITLTMLLGAVAIVANALADIGANGWRAE